MMPGGPNALQQPMAAPQAQAPAVNPMALLSMGQSMLGRALGNNPYDTHAMAEVISQGLMGANPMGQMQRPGPRFNPVNAL